MAGKTSRYSPKKDAEIKVRLLGILDNASDSVNPTLDWIKMQDPIMLQGYSTQKLSRLLGSLVEMGLVRKGKSKSLNRMVYRLTARMVQDGYEVDEDIVEQAGFGVEERAWNGTDWELEDELTRCE